MSNYDTCRLKEMVMTQKHVFAWLGLAGLLLVLTACPTCVRTEAPPAPEMPAHWKVVFDVEIAPDQIKPIEKNLGADISALRNTAYEVEGKRVQINLIAAPDAKSADRLLARLESMKSKEALLRKGLVIYEFVGSNEVLPFIHEGREHIASMKQ
jgi:hypothetical protein